MSRTYRTEFYNRRTHEFYGVPTPGCPDGKTGFSQPTKEAMRQERRSALRAETVAAIEDGLADYRDQLEYERCNADTELEDTIIDPDPTPDLIIVEAYPDYYQNMMENMENMDDTSYDEWDSLPAFEPTHSTAVAGYACCDTGSCWNRPHDRGLDKARNSKERR